MNNIINIYESTSTDGYTDSGDGRFFLSQSEAETAGKLRHSGWSSRPKTHTVFKCDDGGFLLLARKSPVYLENSPQLAQLAQREKENALNKLSDREKEILGLKN